MKNLVILNKQKKEESGIEETNMKHLVKYHAYQNIPLNFEEAYALGTYALEGCRGNPLAQIQSTIALSSLHNKATYAWRPDGISGGHCGHRLPANAAEQIAGVCAAVFEHDIALSEFGFLNPKVPYAIDNSGMGGDLTVTANVSTLAAFIAAAAGIPICKHGSPANADGGRHGSSDFISLLGINTYGTKKEVESCIESEGFGYTEALDTRFKRIHLQTHEFAMLPHMNDIIGPITNPLSSRLMKKRILGVNHLVSPLLVAEAYGIMNEHKVTKLRHGVFIRGQGMDEVSVCQDGTQVAELRDDTIDEYRLGANDFGLRPIPPESVSPPRGMSKGDFSLKILKGEIQGDPLKMILANAAMIFYLKKPSLSLKECYEKAEAVYRSGGAQEKVAAVKKRLPKQS